MHLIFFIKWKEGIIIATIILEYDKRNDLANSIVSSIKSADVFTVVKETESPYSPKFVKKIQESEKQFAKGKCKTIKTSDLWK